MTYSEIMEFLKLAPTKDAGKFVYHLKNLLSTGLVGLEKGTRRYQITELGLRVNSFSQELAEYALRKAGRLFVRTSRYTMEEFDRSKIALSLVEEAGALPEVADKISAEAEERMLKLPITYLTAPLIREFVNAILLEKGLEDYRHKLTRLGMPVRDVEKTVAKAAERGLTVEHAHAAAGSQVMTEFMLLNVLPRDLADAHLSGQIHLSDSGYWVLRPQSIYHDLRPFLAGGFKATSHAAPSLAPPDSFSDSLLMVEGLIDAFGGEISGQQAFDYFNIFLAPHLRGIPKAEAQAALKGFLTRVAFKSFGSGGVTLGLEVFIPKRLRALTAVRRSGGKEEYQSFEEEAQTLASLLLEAALDLSSRKPLFNPRLVLKLRAGSFSKKCEEILVKAHELAAKYGAIYIANLTKEPEENSSYLASGERIGGEWTGDWEVDTLRTGCLNTVALNLPRIAYEAKGNDSKFFSYLEKAVKTAVKALEIKGKEIEDRMKQGLLPSLTHVESGEAYYRLNNSVKTIGIVGLNEAVRVHVGYDIYEELMPQHFAVRLVENIANLAAAISEEKGIRLAVSQIVGSEASSRLAELDGKKYGWEMVNVQGGKEHPYYTYVPLLPEESALPQDERLRIEGRFHPLLKGGHFTAVTLEEERSPQKLLKQTVNLCESFGLSFFAYDFPLTYCGLCQKTFRGYLHRCPSCGTTQIDVYARESTLYLPLQWWTHGGKLEAFKRRW
jgi:ribonucleoside-triphosphate reductase